MNITNAVLASCISCYDGMISEHEECRISSGRERALQVYHSIEEIQKLLDVESNEVEAL